MPKPAHDVVVIGAGVIGCAVGYELARRGAAVEVVDQRPVGMGATQASAGVLAPFIEAREGSALLELTTRSLALFDDFIARVEHDSGREVPYRRTGTLDVAFDEAGVDRLRTTAEVLARRGIHAELLDARGARNEEPHLSDGVQGGLLIPSHGFVGASAFTQALIQGATRLGARFEMRHVTRIARRDERFIVETDHGSLTSGAVVIAAGSWSSGIDVDTVANRVPVRPVRGQLLYLSWAGALLGRVTWSERCYFVPWSDGTVLVGATVEDAGFDERTTVAGVRDLLEAACDVVPHSWAAAFLGARVGLRPAATDQLPVIGASTIVPNLMYATGHYRNGILLAPLTALLVADRLLEGREDPLLATVAPSRFGAL